MARERGAVIPNHQSRIPTLDGWRAVAITLVLFDHAVNSSVCAAGSIYWCNRVMVGQTGVNLFFVLSGYLITTRLLEEHRETGAIRLTGFYVRRAFRILPPALLYLGVMTWLALTNHIGLSTTELKGSLLLFRNYQGPEAGFYTGHFWSLSLEEQFYAVWPSVLLALLLVRRRWASFLPIAVAVGIAVWRQIALLHELRTTGGLSTGFFLRTDTRADGLMLGAAAALLLQVRPDAMRKIGGSVWAVVAGCYILVVAHFGLRPTIWEAGLACLVITWTADHPTTPVGRVLDLGVFRWVGRISYSLYIWQQFFFPPQTIAAPLRQVQRWPLGVLGALGCAIASYYLIERPTTRFGRQLAVAVPVSKRVAIGDQLANG